MGFPSGDCGIVNLPFNNGFGYRAQEEGKPQSEEITPWALKLQQQTNSLAGPVISQSGFGSPGTGNCQASIAVC